MTSLPPFTPPFATLLMRPAPEIINLARSVWALARLNVDLRSNVR
ncbi:MAG TPA: hypothetical protein VF614_15150 [Chthoniobacteraceae bacterium]|jgi:hypothetical protein